VLGLSFGGTWAAKLALRGQVDAAVNFGGPIGAGQRDPRQVMNLPHGMTGTFAHALSLQELPSREHTQRLLDAFSLRTQGLLRPQQLAVPLLAVNGDQDAYVPLEDTLVFRDFPRAECLVVRGADHCASDRFLRVAPYVVAWLRMQLLQTRGSKLACRAARCLLPPTERTAMRRTGEGSAHTLGEQR
jgi:esterase FrsA